jgi:hypothetical protein
MLGVGNRPVRSLRDTLEAMHRLSKKCSQSAAGSAAPYTRSEHVME